MGNYDHDIQMFIEEPRPLDVERLTFIRWLVDTGRYSEDLPIDQPILARPRLSAIRA